MEKIISNMKKYVEENGFVLYCFNEKRIDHYGGLIDYDEKYICLNEPKIENAILILLHEIGHLKSFIKKNDIERTTSSEYRELLAYKIGWALRKKFKVKITKEEWKKFNYIL